ncbi:MAG TPA: ankyrin repeat domain-containing protein [Acidobacteriota bacterium]|nr:ankyrin repeat domain-containing protein [Acidobacteriota bacterium]
MAQDLSDTLDRFFQAVRRGDAEKVEAFLAQDARLAFARQDGGLTAYAAALKARHPEIGQILRRHGYQPDLHESALALDWERLDQLAPQVPGQINTDHPIGGTAMYAAALGGAGSDLWRIYRYSGDPSRTFPPSGSPLQAALCHPHLPTAEMSAATLLANGADSNPLAEAVPASAQATETDAQDWVSRSRRLGWTPLHIAASRGSTDLVEMLIRKGADLSAKDAQERTPLELAEASGQEGAARLLRQEKSIHREHSTSRRAYDVNGRPYRAPDLSAFAALKREQTVGAAHRDLDAVRATVQRHPDLAHSVATTTEGAVEAGAHMGRHDMVDFLLEKGAPYSVVTAVMRNDAPRVKELLEEDPLRIHERGAHDFALLWYPVIGRTGPDMLEELLRRGADVEQQNHLGTTALHFAAARDQADMAQLLIEHGADINRRGRKFRPAGHTPLDLAGESVSKLLRARGAKTSEEQG